MDNEIAPKHSMNWLKTAHVYQCDCDRELRCAICNKELDERQAVLTAELTLCLYCQDLKEVRK